MQNIAKYKEQAKTNKTKKWVPAKSRKIWTKRNQRKWKKTSKQNKEGDQGSPREKKNIKCKDKEHESVFKNNLTEPNEYSKGYQTYRKIHIPDLLPF